MNKYEIFTMLIRNTSEMLTAAIAALSFSVVWLTYASRWFMDGKQKLNDHIRLLKSLKAESWIMKSWAGPYPDATLEECKKNPEYNAWWSPTRQVFKFQLTSLMDAAKNALLFSQTFFTKSARLIQASYNIEQYITKQKEIALLKPDLLLKYREILRPYIVDDTLKNHTIDISTFPPEEQDYLRSIFFGNYYIHINLIGNKNKKKSFVSKYIDFIIQANREEENIRKQLKNLWPYIYHWPWYIFLFSFIAIVVGLLGIGIIGTFLWDIVYIWLFG